MKLFLYVICLFFMCSVILLYYRNYRVYKFRENIVNKLLVVYKNMYNVCEVKDFENNTNTLRNILKKHSYHKMLISFKPLTEEVWLTDEEINLLNKFYN